jgi:hypothetical protein
MRLGKCSRPSLLGMGDVGRLEDVCQLADVAGPAIGEEGGEHLGMRGLGRVPGGGRR